MHSFILTNGNITYFVIFFEQTKSKKKKDRDDGRPKRATTAFMIWLNETREEIKKDNPGITVTEIAKKGGELWREMKDKSVNYFFFCCCFVLIGTHTF